MTKSDKAHIIKLKSLLKEEYGELVSSVYCFGSRISKNNTDSDLDILILTSRKTNWEEELRLSKSIVHFGIKHDIVFDIQFMSSKEFEVDLDFHPFVKSIKSTGLYI